MFSYKKHLLIKYIKSAKSWQELNRLWPAINKLDPKSADFDKIKVMFLERGALFVESN